MNHSTDVRVKLKNYVYFGETDEGIWFDAEDRSFLLKDRALYPVVERFVGLLDRGEPIAPAIARAPEKLQGFLGKLIGLLDEHRMLLRLDPADDGLPPCADTSARRELRKLLEDHLEGAALGAALARWRQARIVLAGGGHALRAAAAALAPCAGAGLQVHAPAAQSDAIRAAVADDPHAAGLLQIRSGAPDADAFGWADLLVYASDAEDLAQAQACDAWLRGAAKAGVIALCFRGHACVLPPVEAGLPGLADLGHWLRAAPADAESASATSFAILGCVAAQVALFHFFGIGGDKRRGQLSVVTPALEVRSHPLVSAAAGSGAAAPMVHAARHELPDERTLEPFEVLRLELDPWFDPLCGPLRLVSERALRQMPLLQYPLAVRPAGAAQGAERLAVGWGLDLGQAGRRALLQALAELAAPLVPAPARIAVDVDDEAWRRQAVARAAVASAAFAARHHCAWVDIDAIDDPVLAMLARLLRYHGPRRPLAQLMWCDELPAVAARLWVDDVPVACAAGGAVLPVLAEVLGRACSDHQLAGVAPRYWAGRDEGLPASAPGANVTDWRPALLAHAAALPAARLVRLTALGLPPRFHCGYAVLDDIE
jgi:hypothetical protein